MAYLGTDQPSLNLNFSKNANMVVAQYYQFLRLGFEGYRKIMSNLMKVSAHLAEGILATGKTPCCLATGSQQCGQAPGICSTGDIAIIAANELALDQRNAVDGVRQAEGRLHCIVAMHRDSWEPDKW